MGGFFGVVSSGSCVNDLFFGTDYHSHLGNQRGGLLVLGKKGFQRNIHDISNAQFRSKFQYDVDHLEGHAGIGSISDTGDQPLMTFSHLGTFGITIVGLINNLDALSKNAYRSTHAHFAEMTGDGINPTEMVASLISLEQSFADGIRSAQDKIQGSCSMLLLTRDGVIAVRDKFGRTPVVIGEKTETVRRTRHEIVNGTEVETTIEETVHSFAATFETCAFQNLDYKIIRWLEPGEAVLIKPDGLEQLLPGLPKKRLCTFLFVYYGYPASSYEGINVEETRYRCGAALARHEKMDVDAVAGVPDSGTAHALGYASASGLPYQRSFVKYTPTWPRSFTPANQEMRSLVAKMKLIANRAMLKDKRVLFCDDSIVRGTQLRDNVKVLFHDGAREVHMRIACPPLIYGCPFIGFTSSKSDMELITRRIIKDFEGDENANLDKYATTDSPEYQRMVEEIRRQLGLTSLRFNKLEQLVKAIGLPKCKLCTHCFDGTGCF